MLNWIHRRLRAQEGLTLIELIVVVAIIAILAFTITPRVLDALNNSKLNGARSVANELHSALERYYANKGTVGTETYPTTPTDFATLRQELGNTLGLTNTTTNVFAASPAFDYIVQSMNPADGTVTTPASAPTTSNWYCITFTARDRTPTTFVINPKGVFEGASACTTDADVDPS